MTLEWSSYREFARWTPTVEIRTPSEGRVSQLYTASHWFDYTDEKIELIVRPKQTAKDKFFIMYGRGFPTEVDMFH